MNNISFELKDKEYIVYLSGRIDSSNAAEVESAIYAIPDIKGYENITLDAEKLEYISSAGLRIILRLRKEHRGLKIINASTEVYEILDMTGFTEMVPVQKAYRKLSVEGCEVIGQGANGKVYRLDADTIIKVYVNPSALEDVHRERELARRAFVLGIPTAIPYDVVKVGENYGSVFELLNARSFAKILAAEPERIDEIASLYVDLLKKIHSTDVGNCEMTDLKATQLKAVTEIKDHIPEEKYQKLYKLISDVPECHNMIHGDYHVKNVMLQNGEVLLIDMDTLSFGNPVFEFCPIYNAYLGYTALDHNVALEFLGVPYELCVTLWKKTLELYFGTTDKEYLQTVEDKASVISFMRLLRRNIRREQFKTEKGKKEYDYYRSELLRLIDKVDSLAL